MIEWISVKERLPEKPGFYLGYMEWRDTVEKIEFDGKGGWDSIWGEPTHWSYIPEVSINV